MQHSGIQKQIQSNHLWVAVVPWCYGIRMDWIGLDLWAGGNLEHLTILTMIWWGNKHWAGFSMGADHKQKREEEKEQQPDDQNQSKQKWNNVPEGVANFVHLATLILGSCPQISCTHQDGGHTCEEGSLAFHLKYKQQIVIVEGVLRLLKSSSFQKLSIKVFNTVISYLFTC